MIGMPASAAIVRASRTRSSLSIRLAMYIVEIGTSVRSASTTELRPAIISVEPDFLRLPPGREWYPRP